MKLRKYQETDATEILKWIENEREFKLWSADRYNNYPISPDDMNKNYNEIKLNLEENNMSRAEVLEGYLRYNGVTGFSNGIITCMEALFRTDDTGQGYEWLCEAAAAKVSP